MMGVGIEICKRSTTDIVLLDVNLPDMSGIDVCKTIGGNHSSVKVWPFSMYNEESYVSEILNHGAKVIF